MLKNLFITFVLFFAFNANAENPDIDAIDMLKLREQLSLPQAEDMIMGDKNAPVVFIEYSSLGCPHCREFHKDVFDEMKKKYIDTGKVAYIYRQFPTNKAALAASKLSLCVGQDKFFPMLTALFNSQSSWAFTEKYKENLINIGTLAGIDQSKVSACFEDKMLEDRILKVSMLGSRAFEITGTPFFIVNGERVEGGKPLAYFMQLLEGRVATALAIRDSASSATKK